MKTMKIILVFVLIMAIVVAALLIEGISKHIVDDGGMKSPYASLSQRIDDNWSDVQGISEVIPICETCYNTICQALDISDDDKSELHEKNIRLALEKVWSLAETEWGKSNCSKKTISECQKSIKKIENLGSDYKEYPAAKFKEIESNNKDAKLFRSVNKAYSEALVLCQRAAPDTADFNSDAREWTPFSIYEKEIEGQIDKVKSGTYWKYISSISYINDGLSNLKNRLPNAKTRYYENLISQVKEFYDKYEVKKSPGLYGQLIEIHGKIKEEGGMAEQGEGEVDPFFNYIITEFKPDAAPNH